MAYENCTSANSCSLGPSLTDICNATTFLAFMTFLDDTILNSDSITGLSQRVDPVGCTDDEYDFIVIGGGAGGSVVASRLSENSEWKVLVLEAGHDEPLAATIPGWVTGFLHTEIDWNYATTGEKRACLTTNGSCYWPSGKTLGGSTILAGGAYLRGAKKDYDDWSDEYGNEGWAWEDVFEYFLRSEDNQQIDEVDSGYHATGGPLPVSKLPYLHPVASSFLDAAEELGYRILDDLNGVYNTGFAEFQFMGKNGTRRTSAASFLWPARDRKNLDVSLNSLVTKIIIENGTAVGVEYYKNGVYKTVTATKEVIVCAGSMRSPHLLLLSGIGPREDLEYHGIEVVQDLPGVGENLHNHVTYVVQYISNDSNVYDNNYDVANEYFTNQTGPSSGIGLATVASFLASSLTTDESPDLLIYPGGYLPGCAPGEVGALRGSGGRNWFIVVTNTRAKSKGKVSLSSSDPLEYPVLWGNYFAEEDDITVLVEGIEKAIELGSADAFAVYNLTLSNVTLEGCSDYEYPSREYWACAVTQNTVPENHQAGSCKMGNETDPLAVVDAYLRVYGINGLRVADASVIPQVPSAPPAPAAMMIAERAAEFIASDWS